MIKNQLNKDKNVPIAEEYFKAGKISSEVRNLLRRKIRVGSSLLDIAEYVEMEIKKRKGSLAFPCNVCINEVAAHYTPSFNDKTVVKDGDLVKIDFGVHIDGYLVDNAISFSFNHNFDLMVNTAELALSNAIQSFKENVNVADIGTVINSTVQKRGYKVISNLSGHKIDQFQIHAGLSVPNIWVNHTHNLKKNEIYAVEPFVTTSAGSGTVIDTDFYNIYSIVSRKRTGNPSLDELSEKIWSSVKGLPFSSRLIANADYEEIEKDLRNLVNMKILRAYPVLVELNGTPVSQAEHTLALTENGTIVLTE